MNNQNSIIDEKPSVNDANKNDSASTIARSNDSLIGQRLKELRKQKSMTQKDLANAIGVSAQQIQKYEKGQDRISFSRIYELSQYMNISIESFALFTTNKNTLSDNNQSPIEGLVNGDISEAEKNEILSIFTSIKAPTIRKDLLKLIKSMASASKE